MCFLVLTHFLLIKICNNWWHKSYLHYIIKNGKERVFLLFIAESEGLQLPKQSTNHGSQFFNQSKDIFKFGPFTLKSVKSFCKSTHESFIHKLKHSAIVFQKKKTWQFPPDWFHFTSLSEMWFQNYTINPKKEWHSIPIRYVHLCWRHNRRYKIPIW